MARIARTLAVTVTVAVAVLAVATACTDSPTTPPGPSPPSGRPAPSSATGGGGGVMPSAHCARRGITGDTGMPEIHGVSVSHASLWGLVFAQYPLQPHQGTKIAWRMTGSGPLLIHAVSPKGQRIEPTWGPGFHEGSNWNRPGQEWGTEFRFPSTGCWTIDATRGSSRAIAGVLVG